MLICFFSPSFFLGRFRNYKWKSYGRFRRLNHCHFLLFLCCTLSEQYITLMACCFLLFLCCFLLFACCFLLFLCSTTSLLIHEIFAELLNCCSTTSLLNHYYFITFAFLISLKLQLLDICRVFAYCSFVINMVMDVIGGQEYR